MSVIYTFTSPCTYFYVETLYSTGPSQAGEYFKIYTWPNYSSETEVMIRRRPVQELLKRSRRRDRGRRRRRTNYVDTKNM